MFRPRRDARASVKIGRHTNGLGRAAFRVSCLISLPPVRLGASHMLSSGWRAPARRAPPRGNPGGMSASQRRGCHWGVSIAGIAVRRLKRFARRRGASFPCRRSRRPGFRHNPRSGQTVRRDDAGSPFPLRAGEPSHPASIWPWQGAPGSWVAWPRQSPSRRHSRRARHSP